jgi:hypothetical protein
MRTNQVLTHGQMSDHIRDRIRHEGIEASVSGHRSRGVQWITVTVENAESFTPQQCRKIALIASLNGLTYAQGEPVDCSDAYWSLQDAVSQFEFVDCRTRVKTIPDYDRVAAVARRRERQKLHRKADSVP